MQFSPRAGRLIPRYLSLTSRGMARQAGLWGCPQRVLPCSCFFRHLVFKLGSFHRMVF